MSKVTQSFSNLPETGYLRLSQVLHYIPVSRSTWWAGMKTGRFPQGYKLGPNTTAWRAEDIRQLIEELYKQEPSVKTTNKEAANATE